MSEYLDLAIKILILEEEIKQLLEPLRKNLQILQTEIEERKRRQFERRSRSRKQTTPSPKEFTEREEEEKLAEILRLDSEIREAFGQIKIKSHELQQTLQYLTEENKETNIKPPAPDLSQPAPSPLSIYDLFNGNDEKVSNGSTTAYPSPSVDVPPHTDPTGERLQVPTDVEGQARFLRRTRYLQDNQADLGRIKRSMLFGSASYLIGGISYLYLGWAGAYTFGLAGFLGAIYLTNRFFSARRRKAKGKLQDLDIENALILDQMGLKQEALKKLEKHIKKSKVFLNRKILRRQKSPPINEWELSRG